MKKARIIYLIIGLITAAIATSQDLKLRSSLNNNSWEVLDIHEKVINGESSEDISQNKHLIAYISKEEVK